MLDIKLIERGLEKPGKTKGGLAAAMGVRPGAVSEILSGIRLIKASEIAPITEYLELNSVPIMGRVGAGDASVDYAAYVELGTRKMAPQPFLRPSALRARSL